MPVIPAIGAFALVWAVVGAIPGQVAWLTAVVARRFALTFSFPFFHSLALALSQSFTSLGLIVPFCS